MGRKKDHFAIFSFVSSSFSFLGKEWNRNWEWEKSSFPPLFPFFLFLFFRFFSSFLLLKGKMGVGGSRNFSSSFSYFIPYYGKEMGRKMEMERRNFFLFFFLIFSISSFWLPFSFSVFSSFWGGEIGSEEDKRNCPKHAKRNLQEHSIFLIFVFGEENTPKIHILCQKYA